MGKQFGLALTRGDLLVVDSVIRSAAEGDTVVIADHINPERRALELLSTVDFDVIDGKFGSVFCFITLSDLVESVVVRQHGERKYAIDVEASCVVELWRPLLLANGKMRPGRLYYAPTMQKDGKTEPKDPVFVRWADLVLARVRRSLVRDARTGLFVGMEAGDAMATGRLIVES